MQLAIELARKGEGKVNPNPMVGAVIVRDGIVIGEGYHEKYGEGHAEVNAFKSLKEDPSEATMYVTLEPCSHYGKTPPCVDKIVENNIKRVVIGMIDPNPLVAGKGIDKLKKAGIEVKVGILEDECKKLNEVFIKYILSKKPFVVLKAAMSLDGKIATRTGELTCRIQNGSNPIRIIVDSILRIPMNSKVLQNKDNKTIIATTKRANMKNMQELLKKNIKVLIIEEKNGQVNLNALIKKLGELNIDSILLEGGGTLNYSALEENIVDKVMIYISPKIIGGEFSKTPVGGIGIDKLNDAFKLKDITANIVDEDILVEGYIG